MVSTSALDNLRHIRSQLNYSARIEPASESLLQTDPSASEKRIAFTKLQLPGYTIGTLEGKRLSSLAMDADLFHPVAIPHSPVALAELTGTTSRIVRIDLDEQSASDVPLAVEVEDGERPEVSRDGQWLAFIREVHGRGSLWIKRLETVETAEGAPNDEWQIVGPDYDVLEAAFDANGSEIIFAGQPHGGPALFTIERTSSLITQNTFGSASRYPAVSPDGLWIAYCKLKKGSWQIWLKPHRGGPAERQLTTGECNSISPAWTPDSREILYATDCGRGWGMTVLARIPAVP
jgi:Tol biopolymer transport system component